MSSGPNLSHTVVNPSETKRRGRPPKPRIPLDRSSAAPALALPTIPVREQNTEVVAPPAVGPIPTLRASTAPVMTPVVNSAETLGGNVTAAHRSFDTVALDPQPRRASPSKPHIILKVKSTPESYSNVMVPCSTDGEDTNTDDESLTEHVQTASSPIHANEVSFACVAEPHYDDRATMVTDLSPHPIMTQPITSIADVVRGLSTDSESQTSYSSSSTTSETDSDGDTTFTPRRAWATVNADSVASTSGASSRGDSSAGRTRGRGRGRGWSRDGMPGSGSHGVNSRPIIIEKGQQTLGTFFLRPLMVDGAIKEGSPSLSFEEEKIGEKRKGSEAATNGQSRVKSEQDMNQDEEMKDS